MDSKVSKKKVQRSYSISILFMIKYINMLGYLINTSQFQFSVGFLLSIKAHLFQLLTGQFDKGMELTGHLITWPIFFLLYFYITNPFFIKARSLFKEDLININEQIRQKKEEI